MSTAQAATLDAAGSPGLVAPAHSAALRAQLQRAGRRKRLGAIALTLPLLLFLLATLLVPIGALLLRAVENPEVATTLQRTGQALHGWRHGEVPAAAYAALAQDLAAIDDRAQAGALARRLNSEASGARSLIMGAYRAVHEDEAWARDGAAARDKLLALDERWSQERYWQAIAKNAARWTPDYLLTAVDLKRDPEGGLSRVEPEQRVFGRILARTLGIGAVVTLLCALLAYPLAWWLSTLPARRANMLMILVLVPFWTSILVRVAAWIVLLQREGLVNGALMFLGVVSEPLELLFNRTGVIIAMVHILLPFMILPLYSVMRTVPPSYLRAAISLGSPPLAAFFRVVLPQTLPGVGAGGLLVFILALGYYVTPALLGGADDQMLSYYIAQYTNVDVNWGMACALGAVLLAATLLLYGVYRRLARAELSLG
ncbi:ABC transporter permease [Azohydromonas aeria]|uniref:ABC transporter permease n=1 Tax=Azohydromonas aeria TaxID=2590212 RepID=UPI0012F7A580|nr:ABC transporter permease [Azohydromonas aeria]